MQVVYGCCTTYQPVTLGLEGKGSVQPFQAPPDILERTSPSMSVNIPLKAINHLGTKLRDPFPPPEVLHSVKIPLGRPPYVLVSPKVGQCKTARVQAGGSQVL